MAVNVVSFSFSSTAQPEAQGPSSLLDDGFLYCILSASSLDPNSSGPQAPSVWCGFPYHISSITPAPALTATATVLTKLYNSSTSTWSPTRSLEWNDWSSFSGNNFHAVHRSLSSGASVYECIMGFTLSQFISQTHPCDLFWLLAIGMCHFLPVHHPWMAFLVRSKAKIQQNCRRFLL